MIFKFLYEGISKKLIFSLLTIIQFTIATISIYSCVQFLSYTNSLMEKVNTQFADDRYYKIDDTRVIEEIRGADLQKNKQNLKILKDINRYFSTNKDIELMSATSDSIFMKKDEAIPETLVTYASVNVNNTEYMRVQGIHINKIFLEKMNYTFIDGGFEKFDSIDDKSIPIILGSIYKDKYSVGDIIETILPGENGESEKSKLKVIGILADDNYINLGGVLLNQQSLNNSILIPFREEYMMKESEVDKVNLIQRVELFNYIQGGYIITKDGESIDGINDYLFKSGLKFQLKDFNKFIKEYKEDSYQTIKPAIYISFIVILFCTLSVIIVMINTISKERKVYGINIMLGATMKDIKNRILGEVIVLLSISGIISIFVLSSFTIFIISIFDLIVTFLALIGILIIISIAITINLKKYSINDLIRRSE